MTVGVSGQYGDNNTKGKIVIKPQFYSVGAFADGLAYYYVEKDAKYGLINKSGKWVYEPTE